MELENITAEAANNLIDTIATQAAATAQPPVAAQPPATPAAVDATPAAPITPPVTPQAPAFGEQDVEKFLATTLGRDVKISDIKGALEKPSFASDMVAKINQLQTEGKTLTEISQFVQLQSLDVTALADVDAIRMNMKIQNPTFSDSMIDALITRQVADPASSDEGDKAVLAQAAARARKEISEQKVNSDVKLNAGPDPAKLAEDTARRAVLESNWPRILTAATSNAEVPVTVALEQGDYQFSYKVPEAVLASALKEATQIAVSQGMPFDQKNVADLKGMAMSLAVMQDFQNFSAAMVKDAFESGRQSALLQISTKQAPSPVKLADPVQPGQSVQKPRTYVQ